MNDEARELKLASLRPDPSAAPTYGSYVSIATASSPARCSSVSDSPAR